MINTTTAVFSTMSNVMITQTLTNQAGIFAGTIIDQTAQADTFANIPQVVMM